MPFDIASVSVMTHRKARLLGPNQAPQAAWVTVPVWGDHCTRLGSLGEIAFFMARTCEAGRRRMQRYCNGTDRGWPEKKQFPSTVQKHPKLHKPDHNGLRFLKFDYLGGITKAKNYLSIDLHDEVEESDDVPFSGMKSGAPS